MRNTLSFFAAVFFACYNLLPLSANAAPRLQNGVSIHGPMTWGRANAKSTGYLIPVYDNSPRYQLPVTLLPQVRQSGFDFIRLTVDPGPFMALQGADLDALYLRLSDMVKQIQSYGLDVVVDFHPIGMVPAYSSIQIETSDTLFNAYVAVITRTATMLSGLNTDKVALELMNEPQYGYNPQQISHEQQMMQTMYAAARKVAPSLTLIVSGGQGGSVNGLVNLDPKPFLGPNTRFTFHYYYPFIFTMQGVQGGGNARIWQYIANLPYPSTPADLNTYWNPVAASINNAATIPAADKPGLLAYGLGQFQDYFLNGKGTRAGIAADMNKVSYWAKIKNIPPGQIWLGEFGATQQIVLRPGALPDARARWLADVRQEAESRGFTWSMWALSGDTAQGMILTSPFDNTKLDPVTLKALGH